MRRLWTTLALIPLLVGSLGGCGADADGLSGLSASLLIPQDLALDLVSVTIYAYETDPVTKAPLCPVFMNNAEAYKSYREQTRATIAFQTDDTASLELPDRGPVWRIYGRGYDANNLAIGHGCFDGVIDVDPEATAPTTVDLPLTRIP